MPVKITGATLINYIFGLLLFIIGILNLFLVHPIPGVIFLLASLLYFDPVNKILQNKLGITIPLLLKIILALILIWFTLGVSDLGDIIDDWLK